MDTQAPNNLDTLAAQLQDEGFSTERLADLETPLIDKIREWVGLITNTEFDHKRGADIIVAPQSVYHAARRNLHETLGRIRRSDEPDIETVLNAAN